MELQTSKYQINFKVYCSSRGATFWVISKNHDAAPNKFCIGHQLTIGSALTLKKLPL